MSVVQKRTVRELGGEIWAEILPRINENDSIFASLDLQTLNTTIDLIMGVLARHDGAAIVNDPDLPVTPLPRKEETQEKE